MKGPSTHRYRSSRSRRRRRFRLVPARLARMAGLLLVIGGLIVLARIPYFYVRSWWVGQHLVHETMTSAPKKPATSAVASAASWPPSLMDIIRIPTLNLTAPVLQGIQDAELNVAVGHLPTSVNPGTPGLSVLAGHDVTWFRHINRLKPGDTILVEGRHHTYTFHVTHSAVVHVGTPIYNTTTPSIVLEACYPLNALYLTPYRYMVWATLAASPSPTKKTPDIPPNTQYTPVGIPPAVAAQGLTLATNYLPMGQLTILGDPSPAWKQSNAPLNAADATTTLFLAALHIAQANNATWWHQLAPNIPYSTIMPLVTGQIVHYMSLVNESEQVHGQSLDGTKVQLTVDIGGGIAPGVYQITATMMAQHHLLRLTRFTLESS